MFKFISYCLLAFFIFLNSKSVFGQEQKQDQAVFIEGLGSGILFSFNYEKKLLSITDKLAIRAGVGYTSTEGVRLTTVPVSGVYLFGKKRNFLEIGAGFTLLRVSDSTSINPLGSQLDSDYGILAAFGLGYRRVAESGFMLRAGITPLFGAGLAEIFWPQISVGYAF